MPRYSVLVPSHALAAYLDLAALDLARQAVRALALDPRPSWAHEVPGGYCIELGGGEWIRYEIDDGARLVTVVAAGRRGT